jgi:hypothetical protein
MSILEVSGFIQKPLMTQRSVTANQMTLFLSQSSQRAGDQTLGVSEYWSTGMLGKEFKKHP